MTGLKPGAVQMAASVPIMITHGEVHFHHRDDIWLLKAHIIISLTVSGGSSAAVVFCYREPVMASTLIRL